MAWDSTLPQSTTLISDSASIIQGNFAAIQNGDVTGTTKVRLDERISESVSAHPSNVSNVGYLYVTNVNSKGELHFLDEDDNKVQITNAGSVYGQLVQVVKTSDVTAGSTATALPVDDSPPQNTEGAEFTTLSITPKDSNNTLIIDFFVPCTSLASDDRYFTLALFQDSKVNALTATTRYFSETNDVYPHSLRYVMTAGTTMSTTFKIRYGMSIANTAYMNSVKGTQKLGGVEQWNFTITEVQ